MTRWVRVWLAALCWLAIPPSVLAGDASSADEQLLRKFGLNADGQSLLDFFRKQTPDAAMIEHVRQRIAQLGADTFALREQASSDLAAQGAVALPLLRETIQTTRDLEARRRARECVQQIQTRFPPTLTAAAARLLAQQKPPGTEETLLAFLPGPYDDSLTEEIQTTLIAAARGKSEVDPSLPRALESTTPARRSAAAVTLCRIGASAHWPAVRKLLQDADANVRLQAARELAIVGERRAVPVLIELLAQLSIEQAEAAEELLYRLAGPQSPPTVLGRDSASQQKCRDAWRSWWRDHGEKVEMAALKDRQRQLGYTLLVLLNDNRIVEWDRENKTRWQITGLASPLDAQVIAERRVLIAEHDTKRVTERTLKGEVLWEKKLSDPPFHAQRLSNGRTFIATRKQLVEVDRAGNETIRYRSENSGIITARHFRDGRIGCIEKGHYFELDAAGVERKRFAVSSGVFTTNSLTLLPNGHLLIAAYGGGVVLEYNRAGEIVWQLKMNRPLCALRLPSGHTLISSQDMLLMEFDRTGKEIARHDAAGHPCQIRRR